jgi:hypothetical protein
MIGVRGIFHKIKTGRDIMPINKCSVPSIALLSSKHKIFPYGVICKNNLKIPLRVLGASLFFKFLF